MSLSSRHGRSPLTYLSSYHMSRTAPVPPNRPCICKNCKQMFWSYEENEPVAGCVGHPGEYTPPRPGIFFYIYMGSPECRDSMAW